MQAKPIKRIYSTFGVAPGIGVELEDRIVKRFGLIVVPNDENVEVEISEEFDRMSIAVNKSKLKKVHRFITKHANSLLANLKEED